MALLGNTLLIQSKAAVFGEVVRTSLVICTVNSSEELHVTSTMYFASDLRNGEERWMEVFFREVQSERNATSVP